MALSNRSRRQKTLIATAIAALIAGAIVAVVATTGTDHGHRGVRRRSQAATARHDCLRWAATSSSP
jgi:hypothetical protein